MDTKKYNLRPCPFCGGTNIKPREGLGWSDVTCMDCPFPCASEGIWNTRPIEDALQARIAELEAKLDAYAEREQWHPFIVNKNEPNESGYYLTVQRVGKFATIILTEHWVASPGFWDTKAIVTHWRELPAPPEEQ